MDVNKIVEAISKLIDAKIEEREDEDSMGLCIAAKSFDAEQNLQKTLEEFKQELGL
tara:strand:+ start:54147 stop:54314 length:168 start_codon:yes stop_codon:yes gene_type:complete